MDKAALRKEYSALRLNLSQGDVTGKSRMIARTVQLLVHWGSVRGLHAYQSNTDWHEVETEWVEPFIAQQWPHITVSHPQVLPGAPISSGVFDVVIVPVVAFDSSCNRLGHGGGWYDRFLAIQPNALKIGLAFDIQQAEQLPIEPHDVTLDYVITESRTITKSASRQSQR